jgi:spermidine synthase
MIFARRAFAALYLLGAASTLALEVVWTRLMALAMGSTVEAVACVLAAFMGGLGAGAFLASEWGDRIRRPVRTFATVQLLGALAATLPYLVFLLPAKVAFFFGLISVVLASFPLGFLFPLAARIRDEDGTGRGSRAGRLYALDTGGALIGCLLAGLLLIPTAGLFMTLLLAGGLKLLVAALVVPLCGRTRFDEPDAETDGARSVLVPSDETDGAGEEAEVAAWGRKLTPLLLLVAVQGFALLGAENIFSRVLAFVLYRGSTTYAFVAMLATVLGFTSLGAWMAGRKTDEDYLGRAWRFAVQSGVCLLLSLAVLLVVGPVPESGALGPIALLVTLLACGPAAFFSGAVFSSACRAAVLGGAALGAGRVLAANTLFGVLGALLVPLVFVPLLGLGATLAVLGILPVAAGLFVSKRGEGRRPWPAAVATLLAAVLLMLSGPRWVRHLGEVVFYQEGPDVSVAVTAEPDGSKRLFVDGIAVAGTDLIMSTDQKTLAHLPVLLHPDPRSVLTVGFGSGGTSYSLLLHSQLQVDCAEISPAVIGAAPYLKEANRGLLDHPSPRYRLHQEDARRFLAITGRRFDIIVNDCTDLAYRSDASLYTRDFFRLVRRHLAPGGIAAAWVPLRGEPPYRVMKSVLGSFAAVFENVSLWVFDAHPVHFGILLGGDRRVDVDMARLKRILKNPRVARDLKTIGLDDPLRLATSRHLGDRELRAWVAGIPRHTDDRPVVEFWAPWEAGDDASAYRFIQAAGASFPAVVRHVGALTRRDLGCRIASRPFMLSGHRAWLEDDEEEARRFYLHALQTCPGDPAVRVLLGIGAEKISRLEEHSREPLSHPDSLVQLGAVRLYEGEYSKALGLFAAGLVVNPKDAGSFLGIGLAHLGAGSCRAARVALFKVLASGASKPLRDRALSALVLARLPGPLCRGLWALTFAGL